MLIIYIKKAQSTLSLICVDVHFSSLFRPTALCLLLFIAADVWSNMLKKKTVQLVTSHVWEEETAAVVLTLRAWWRPSPTLNIKNWYRMCEEEEDSPLISPLTQHTQLSTAGKTGDTHLANSLRKTINNMPDWCIVSTSHQQICLRHSLC